MNNIHQQNINTLQRIIGVIKKRDRRCICSSCHENAINSHVLSKSHILKPISVNSKIYQFNYRPLYYPNEPVFYKLEGINQAYVFKGFCSNHDKEIFLPIEPSIGYVDWSNIKNGIFNGDCTDYKFEHIELPFQFDLCVCSPIHVDDGKGICFKYDYQESNIVMIFPYYGKTEIIIGYSQNFENVWMNHIISEFRSGNPLSLSRAFANVLYRIEFNAMSPTLYHSLDPALIELFLKTFIQNASVYSLDIYGVEKLFLKPLNLLMSNS